MPITREHQRICEIDMRKMVRSCADVRIVAETEDSLNKRYPCIEGDRIEHEASPNCKGGTT